MVELNENHIVSYVDRRGPFQYLIHGLVGLTS